MKQVGPLLGSVATVKGGVWNGATYDETESLTPLREHLAGEQSHLEIEPNPYTFAQIGNGIEAAAVVGVKKDRHYVTMVFHRLLDECGLPFQIPDHTFLATGKRSRWIR